MKWTCCRGVCFVCSLLGRTPLSVLCHGERLFVLFACSELGALQAVLVRSPRVYRLSIDLPPSYLYHSLWRGYRVLPHYVIQRTFVEGLYIIVYRNVRQDMLEEMRGKPTTRTESKSGNVLSTVLNTQYSR